MKRQVFAVLVLAFLGAAQADTATWEDENGATHFYQKPTLRSPSPGSGSYGAVDKANEARAAQQLEADKKRWAEEDAAAAKAAKERRAQQLEEMKARAAVSQAREARRQADAQEEQARQEAIANEIRARQIVVPRY